MPGFYDSFVGGQRNALARQAAEAGIAKNALDTQQEAQGIDLKQTLAETQWALQAPDPVAAVKSLPHIAAAWQQHGVNIDALDPAHAKALLQEGQRQAASQLGIGPPEQPTQLQDVPLPGGAIGQRDPRTNALSVPFRPQNESSTPVAIVDPKTGKPTYTTPQGAIGNRPYDKPNSGDTFSPDSVENTAQLIYRGQIAPLSGFALKTPWGQAVTNRLAEIDKTQQAGGADAFSGGTFGQRASALRAFTSGTQGNSVRFMNVAISHINTLQQLGKDLDNGNVQAFNKLKNAWRTATGSPLPTSFSAARDIVANEVVKAVTASGGALADRQEAQSRISEASSWAQLAEIADTWKQLLAGQLGGLRLQYEQGTGMKDFNKKLYPETLKELSGLEGGGPPPPAQQEYTATDAQGNKVAWRNGQWVPVGQ